MLKEINHLTPQVSFYLCFFYFQAVQKETSDINRFRSAGPTKISALENCKTNLIYSGVC